MNSRCVYRDLIALSRCFGEGMVWLQGVDHSCICQGIAGKPLLTRVSGHSSVTDVCVTLRSYSRCIRAVLHWKNRVPTPICGAFGVLRPNSSKIWLCSSQNSRSLLCSSATFCVTEMFTMEPVVAPGGRRREGNSMRWARSPKRI
jgi:hypothetical protein